LVYGLRFACKKRDRCCIKLFFDVHFVVNNHIDRFFFSLYVFKLYRCSISRNIFIVFAEGITLLDWAFARLS
jgi:hypothetical protein